MEFENKRQPEAQLKSTAGKIAFAPPYIDEDVIDEVVDTLRSGWITTGPKVKALEQLCAQVSGCEACLCVNSWTSGAQLVLKWWGIGPGDEVILPAYTYAATALVVMHAGATPVLADIGDDLTIDSEDIKSLITSHTKAIFPVDIGGWPCDYDGIRKVVNDPEVQSRFSASNERQRALGRILIVSDAAHSIGSSYGDAPSALQSDITIYSFHAVKRLSNLFFGHMRRGDLRAFK